MKKKKLVDIIKQAEHSKKPELFTIDLRALDKKIVMVYPEKWREDPDKQKEIPDDPHYFLPYLRQPKEMTFGEYRKKDLKYSMRDLDRYLKRKREDEKKYSNGKVMFGAALA